MVSLKSELSCGLATVVEERTNLATFLDTTATMQTFMAHYGYQVGKYFMMLSPRAQDRLACAPVPGRAARGRRRRDAAAGEPLRRERQ